MARGFNSRAQEAETGGWEGWRVWSQLGLSQTSSSSKTVRIVFSRALHLTIS